MLPHRHFLIAGLTIAPVSVVLFPEKSLEEIWGWVLIGGILSASIDLDIYALVLLKSRKENQLTPFRNPIEIYRNFESFMNTIFKTGLWKIGLVTHLALSVLIVILFYLFSNTYFIPAVLGVISHIITDMPNLQRRVI